MSFAKTRTLLFLFSFTLFVVFYYFSYLVNVGMFNQFDFDTTVRFQDHISTKLDFPFSILSLAGSVEVTFVIWSILAIFLLLKRYHLSFLSLFLFPVGLLVEFFGKSFLYHPSPPYMFYRGINFFLPSHYVHTSYSYPSGHVFRTTFLVTFLIFLIYFRSSLIKKIIIPIILLAFLLVIYISRIYLGEHWASDVIGGALLGGSTGVLSGITIPSKNFEKENT